MTIRRTPISDREFLQRKTPFPYETSPDPVRVVDLFAGCGGMTLGLAEAARRCEHGIEVPLAIDFDSVAVDVFNENLASVGEAQVGDVSEFFELDLDSELTDEEEALRERVGAVDFLVGGPPCQGNSDLNNHTRRKDERNALYALMARAARVLDPRFVLVENVPAVQRDRKDVVGTTVQALEALDYRVYHQVVDLSEIGVPQRRRRHLLFAIQKQLNLSPEDLLEELSSQRKTTKSVWWAIGDLKRPRRKKRRTSRDSENLYDTHGEISAANKARIQWLFTEKKYDLDDEQRPDCHKKKSHTYRSVYGRMHKDKPAQTITTGFGSMGQGRYVHPTQRRTITPHEAARIQTFPDFFTFQKAPGRTHLARLIGNAVPPLLTLQLGLLLVPKLPKTIEVQPVKRSARTRTKPRRSSPRVPLPVAEPRA